MRLRTALWLAVWGLCLSACERPLVIYADPWLGGYAEQIEREFQKQHPDTRIELRFLSSELVAWHIHYGQPIDIFLCMGPEWLDSVGIRDRVTAAFPLADERMALVEVIGKDQTAYFKTQGCVALEASHRPARTWTDAWLAATDSLKVPDCRIYAGFQAQLSDQVLHGWVKRAFVPAAFAARHPKRLAVLAQGPVHPDAYMAYRIQNGQQNEDAAAFFTFLQQEKSLKVLAKEELIH